MDRIFNLELTGENGYSVTQALPATAYEMMDAFDRLRVSYDSDVEWDILSFARHARLENWIGSGSIHELNTLARKLSEMSAHESVAFDGLVDMEKAKGLKIIPMDRLIDLAYSADSCHVLTEARSEADLGRFFVENGFVKELETVPEAVFDMLDYAKIGRDMCAGAGGILINRGYVEPTEVIRSIHETIDFSLNKPAYTALMELGIMNSTDHTHIGLPADDGTWDAALERLGAVSWDEVVFRCIDCRIPRLRDAFAQASGKSEMNEAAMVLEALSDEDVRTCKAVLAAAEVGDLADAVTIMKAPGDYVASPQYTSYSDIGREEIKFQTPPETAELLLKHIHLYEYGKDVAAHDNLILTEYGGIERRDGQPIMIHTSENQPALGGMEMQSI